MTTRERLSAWWRARPEATRKFVPWAVGVSVVLLALGWFVWDTSWAGLLRGTIAGLIVFGGCAMWYEWRSRQRKA